MTRDDLKKIAISACIVAGKYLNENKLAEKEILMEEGRDIKLIIDQKTEELIRSILQKTDIDILVE